MGKWDRITGGVKPRREGGGGERESGRGCKTGQGGGGQGGRGRRAAGVYYNPGAFEALHLMTLLDVLMVSFYNGSRR